MKRFLSYMSIVIPILLLAYGTILIFFNLIPDIAIPKYTFTLMTAISLAVVVRIYLFEDKLNCIHSDIDQKYNYLNSQVSNLQHLTSLVSGRVLSSNSEFYNTLISLITPHSELCVTTFSDFAKLKHTPGEDVKIFFKTLDTYLSKNDSFSVKRIAYVPNKEKLDWLEETITNAGMSVGYHLAIISTDPGWTGLMNMTIVDSRHVVLFGRHRITDEPNYIYIDNIEIALVAKKLFSEWWKAAEVIKEGGTLFSDKLDRVRGELEKTSASV